MMLDHCLFSPSNATEASHGTQGIFKKLQVEGTNPNEERLHVPLLRLTTKSILPIQRVLLK